MGFPMARKYFLEHHPMRDLLGTVYSQYFLSYLKYNSNSEAKIFAYGFLFHTAFLQENLELMELYYSKIKEIELVEDIHVIVKGLKFGVQLLYTDFINNDRLFKKTFTEMKKVRENCISASQKSVCSFEYTVLESLIFTNRLKEIKFLLKNNTIQIESDEMCVPQSRKQSHDEVWKIICAISYQKLGDLEKCMSYLNKVNLDNLGIGWKNYYSILYKFVELDFISNERKLECYWSLKILIDKGCFSYFEQKLNNIYKGNFANLSLAMA